MPENSSEENRELVVVRTPDGAARRALRERAEELGCQLEALPSMGNGVRDTSGPPPLEAVVLCQALVEGTRDEILVADDEGQIRFVSPRLASLAGLDHREVHGTGADRILGAIGLPEFAELRGMLSRVSNARTEAEIAGPAGANQPVLLRGVSVSVPDGGRRFVWLITELSRVRSVERANRLLRSELETQSRLLALVSHELRTPLNVILGQLSLLSGGLKGQLSEDQRDAVERCERAGHGLLSLINDLIDFARLEAEELELEPRRFSLEELLEEVVEVAEPLVAESDLALDLELSGGEDELVVGDPVRTRQIFIQLVTNAVKFSDQGHIRIVTRRVDSPGEAAGADLVAEGGYLAVRVSDSGIGISSEELERVFEPFHQAARLLNRTREGSGLGLAIARKLAQRQGGDLVVSSSEREGSSFTVFLPLAG